MTHRLGRRFRRTVLTTSLIVTFSFAAGERPVHALTGAELWAAVETIKTIYEIYSEVSAIFEGGGPSAADLLSQVEAALLNDLRTQRDQTWRATAQTAFDEFRVLAARPANHPDNPALRDEAASYATTAIEQLAIIVEDGTDVESSYQLAPTFDALVAVRTGLTWMLDEMFPGTIAPWAEYHVYLWRGINTDYRLIGAQYFQCWPGYDPGRWYYDFGTPSETSRSYRDSQLWTRKIANRSVSLGSQSYYPVSISGGQCVLSSFTKTCNPGQKSCWYPGGCSTLPAEPCNAFSCSTAPACGPNMICNSTFPVASWLLQASQNLDPTWNADPVVQEVRAAMTAIMSVGGGDDPYSDGDTSLPYWGMLVDPWVYEPRCGSNPYGAYAYPTVP